MTYVYDAYKDMTPEELKERLRTTTRRYARLNVDDFWDALREQCCSMKPPTDAKVCVLVRRSDIEVVFKALKEQK